VVNEESIVALCLLTVFWAVWNYGGPMYKGWAESQNDKLKDILNTARQNHTDAVKSRIDNVKDLGNVIEVTKSLFEISKVR
jgi:F-type H+-transporting ATPase subunit b